MRGHWGVENGLHWVMDMVFRDDECRIRSAHAPANFATIKHMASNLLRRGKGKHSMRARGRHIAGWDEDFLYSLLTTLSNPTQSIALTSPAPALAQLPRDRDAGHHAVGEAHRQHAVDVYRGPW